MKNKIFLPILIIFLSLSVISASGLNINPSQINLNKTEGIELNQNVKICNNDTKDFFNIQFENNNYLNMPLTNLTANSCKNVSISATAMASFSGIIRLKGQYQSNLGQQNLTHSINVDYSSGLSQCDFSMVQGDTVIWNNLVSGDINLINGDTNAIITTVHRNATYQQSFPSASSFKYYFTLIGYRFTDVCTITALSTNGLINDPAQDIQIPVNINYIYTPTTLSFTILNANYTIGAGSSAQDILNIKNTGNNTAKNVHLVGNWFTFSSNDFDLASGESKNIGYTILPYVTNTSQTNKSYIINLTVSGNFNTFMNQFNVNVPYALITGNSTINSLSLGQWVSTVVPPVLAYCQDNPNDKECTKIMNHYLTIQNNQSDSQSELVKYLIQNGFDEEKFRNLFKQYLDSMNTTVSQTQSSSQSTSDRVTNIESKISSNQDTNAVLIIAMSVLAILYVGNFVFDRIKKKKELNDFEKY
jgi:hypothetical protein